MSDFNHLKAKVLLPPLPMPDSGMLQPVKPGPVSTPSASASFRLVVPGGIEPPTYRLGGGRSIP
jgi:hypothetical protein